MEYISNVPSCLHSLAVKHARRPMYKKHRQHSTPTATISLLLTPQRTRTRRIRIRHGSIRTQLANRPRAVRRQLLGVALALHVRRRQLVHRGRRRVELGRAVVLVVLLARVARRDVAVSPERGLGFVRVVLSCAAVRMVRMCWRVLRVRLAAPEPAPDAVAD